MLQPIGGDKPSCAGGRMPIAGGAGSFTTVIGGKADCADADGGRWVDVVGL